MLKTIKISKNIYNGDYNKGSIFENSIYIVMVDDLFQDNVEKITNDKISSATYRRSFMDNNLNLVSIEFSSPLIEDPKLFIDYIKKAIQPEYQIKKGQYFNIIDYLGKITITINDSDIEYELTENSELGSAIMDITGLNKLIKMSNREVIESINLD